MSLTLSIGSAYYPAFAQILSANYDLRNNIEKSVPISFQQVVSNLGHAPLITHISDKGIYEVQLSWDAPVSVMSLPKDGLWQPHIFFMNASGLPPTFKIIPNKKAESGVTTMGVGTQYRVPGSIKRLLPASSFDMTIYGKDGKVLWNKVNQPVTGGVGVEQVVFPKGYTGDITILIHNIKAPAWLQKIPTDSVEFRGKVA
jgi:hypothetical protein